MGDRQFPILRSAPELRTHPHARLSIPWAMIAPHEKQAWSNHGQTLERLAERGGLSPEEAFAVLTGAAWPSHAPSKDAELERLVQAFEARE